MQRDDATRILKLAKSHYKSNYRDIVNCLVNEAYCHKVKEGETHQF